MRCLIAFMFLVGCSAGRGGGKPDYCYVESEQTIGPVQFFELHAHRPWDTDLKIGKYTSAADAARVAHDIECPLR